VTLIFVVASSFTQMRAADPEIFENRAASATLPQSVIAAAIIIAIC
jgi:hypothetical protein